MTNPLTPAGIEPATFRFVAQHLRHCATAVSHCVLQPTQIYRQIFIRIYSLYAHSYKQKELKVRTNSVNTKFVLMCLLTRFCTLKISSPRVPVAAGSRTKRLLRLWVRIPTGA